MKKIQWAVAFALIGAATFAVYYYRNQLLSVVKKIGAPKATTGVEKPLPQALASAGGAPAKSTAALATVAPQVKMQPQPVRYDMDGMLVG